MNSVIVTGAKGNLGRAVTQTLQSSGWNVVEIDTDNGDLTLPSDAQRLVRGAPGPLRAIAHLVGGIRAGKPLEEITLDDLHAMYSLNLVTAFNIMNAAVPLLRENGGGSIVTIGAQSVIHPVPNRAAYSAIKTAVVSLTQSVAEEGRPFGVRANAILPSVLRTPANLEWGTAEEARGWPTPEQVAATIAHLVDPNCMISGAVIPMFGGVAF